MSGVAAQEKYDFHSEDKTEAFKFALGRSLLAVKGKTDTSYYYYVSLTVSKHDGSLVIDIGGPDSKMKTGISEFFKKNINNISKPAREDRILIPINVFYHYFSSKVPVVTSDIGSVEYIYEATKSGPVFFVRPLRINLAHLPEINEGQTIDENEKARLTSKKFQSFSIKNAWKDKASDSLPPTYEQMEKRAK